MTPHSNIPARSQRASKLNPQPVLSRVFSTDHRTIGIQYLILALVSVIIGTLLSLLMRIHLVWPDWPLPLHGPILPEDYLALVTIHGTIMLFFVLTTAPQAGFGNLILPAQIGARSMAFPGLNAQDVIHGFSVPEMRLKQNAVPGQPIHIHFTPTTPGTYAILCTQLCGLGHYRMNATLRVLSATQFAAWLTAHQQKAPQT